VTEDFVVQVRAGRAAGAANVGNALTALDTLALSHMALADVGVASHETFSVRDLNDISVSVFPAGPGNHAISSRDDRSAAGSSKVQTFVASQHASERIVAHAEATGDPKIARDRNAGRKRLQPRQLTVPIVAKVADDFLELPDFMGRVFE